LHCSSWLLFSACGCSFKLWQKIIIALGYLLLREIMKIKGLQGMMIDGEAMVLTLIVIIIGMTAL
jgi:hypothetical protein